jgi:L-alanine-DL-glutamate epimerase-like enolase superfamily enzyme
MQLVEWSLHTYSLRYEKPIQWSDIVEEAAPFVLLRLQDETGAVGVAEVTVKPTWCGVTARSLIAAVEDIFLPIVAAADLTSPPAIRDALERVPENLAAKTLVDNACWDLYAARTGRSLGDLWGGGRRIDVSWALTRQSPRDMAAEAAAVVARYGFETIKIKGGQGIDVDRAVMRDVRAAIGAEVQLYVDANGAYPYADAAEYARVMADLGALMVEDPCVTSPDARFRQLQEESAVSILVDFGCTSVRDAATRHAGKLQSDCRPDGGEYGRHICGFAICVRGGSPRLAGRAVGLLGHDRACHDDCAKSRCRRDRTPRRRIHCGFDRLGRRCAFWPVVTSLGECTF